MFDKEVLGWRMERALAAVREQNIDLWLTIGRETHLLTDPAFMYLIPCTPGSRTALCIMPSGSVCITSGMHIEEMDKYGVCTQNIGYTTMDDFDQKFENLLRTIPKKGRIALNYSDGDTSADGLRLTEYRRLMAMLKKVGFEGEIVSSQLLMKRTRAQKNTAEVARIGRAVDAAMDLFDDFRAALKVGMSGRDIQKWFQDEARARGYEISDGHSGSPFCSVGARSSYYCVKPPLDIFVQPGDLVNVDLGVRVDDYASDNQRSYYILREGETDAPEDLKHAFATMQKAQQTVVDTMRPGLDTTALARAASKVFEENGFPPVNHLGHELGAFAHEGGMGCGGIGQRIGLDTTLEVGMTFTTEPAIITPYGRLCQEEVITVTPTGGMFHGRRQKELWLIGKQEG